MGCLRDGRKTRRAERPSDDTEHTEQGSIPCRSCTCVFRGAGQRFAEIWRSHKRSSLQDDAAIDIALSAYSTESRGLALV